MTLMLDYGSLQNFLQSIHAFDNFTFITVLNFQVYLWTEEPFQSFFQLAKHVGNINSYQNVNGTTKIRS